MLLSFGDLQPLEEPFLNLNEAWCFCIPVRFLTLVPPTINTCALPRRQSVHITYPTQDLTHAHNLPIMTRLIKLDGVHIRNELGSACEVLPLWHRRISNLLRSNIMQILCFVVFVFVLFVRWRGEKW